MIEIKLDEACVDEIKVVYTFKSKEVRMNPIIC